jgi:4-amino-4-deoxychorismate lyase
MSVETYAHVHHIVSNVSGRCARGLAGAGDPRAVSRRHHHRLSQGPMHGDHRRTRRRRTGRLHRLDRLHQPRRQLRFQYSDPHDHGAGACLAFSAGAGIVADSIPSRNSPRRAPRPKACCAPWRRAHERLDRRPPAYRVDYRDRGLQYGDGLFETMRVQRRTVRLLDLSSRAIVGRLPAPADQSARERLLRREIRSAVAALRGGVLKLIVTRGVGTRGYRPSGTERCTRILSLQPLPRGFIDAGLDPARCESAACAWDRTRRLAGLKTLESPRIGDGAHGMARSAGLGGPDARRRRSHRLRYHVEPILARGSTLTTPLLDRCGVAGVMRRWVLKQSKNLNLRLEQRRVEIADLAAADEVFMSNARRRHSVGR